MPSIISRMFGSKKKELDPLEALADPISIDEAEGLLIGGAAQPQVPASLSLPVKNVLVAAQERVAPPAVDGAEDEGEDSPAQPPMLVGNEADSAGDEAEELEPEANGEEAEPSPDEAPAEPVVTVVGAAPAGDDPLSMFRAAESVNELKGLTADIEDVAADELLNEALALRAKLSGEAA
jgi:hypothetical protein